MSHYAVLVIGEEVEAQLAPFHEFECTGEDNKFVQDIDVTEKIREEFKTHTKPMVKMPDGTLVRRYEDIFYRDPTEEEKKTTGNIGTGFGNGISYTSKDWGDRKGYRMKVRFLPEGCEEIDIPDEDFRTFVSEYNGKPEVSFGESPDLKDKHKYGYSILDKEGNVTKVIDRTNPNSKWDWHQIGGRYSGHLKLKTGSTGEVGERSLLMLMHGDTGAKEGYCDSAKKKDVDFDSMRDLAETSAREEYTKAIIALEGMEKSWDSWDKIREATSDHDLARDKYNTQPQVEAIRKAFKDNFFLSPDKFLVSESDFIESARGSAISTYAVVKDGQWYEKGEMGWFGISDDKMTDEQWNIEFSKLVDSIDGETTLTVVDCHI